SGGERSGPPARGGGGPAPGTCGRRVRPRVTAWTRPARWASGSVAVVVRLVGAFDLHADVLGLLGTERRELHAERVEVQAGDLLVEVLGQHVDAGRVRVGLGEQLDLGQGLVRE